MLTRWLIARLVLLSAILVGGALTLGAQTDVY